MDLSTGIGDLNTDILAGDICSDHDSLLDEILDLSGLDMDDEETWLYKVPHGSDTENVQDWLSGKHESQLPPEFAITKLKSSNAIDTRTFTRPKKKSSRPSLNEIERLYNSDSEGASGKDKPSFRSKVPQTVQEDQEPLPEMGQPLKFDLSQPTSKHNLDSTIGNDFPMISSDMSLLFDMSPPSLLSSLTFSNIMDSSFIKNDAVLSKIRDKDYTETVLLQDFEAPMFQSISESCSSLNSDTPENFLRKVTRENNYVTITPDRVLSLASSIPSGNSTYEVEADPNSHEIADEPNKTTNHSIAQNSSGVSNGTYRRPLKNNDTFTKADCRNNRLSAAKLQQNSINRAATALENDTKGIENSMNRSNTDKLQSTINKYNNGEILRSDSVEDMKKRFSSSSSSIEQLNGMGGSQENIKEDLNATYTDNKVASETTRTMENKRSLLGSADSLDRMSSVSGSSRGSHKRMSMEDVHAIAEMQEQSLRQVYMSTPSSAAGKSGFLLNNDFLSPIRDKNTLSDSELSDEYKSVKSHASSKITLETGQPPSAKSLSCLAINKELKIKTNQRSAYTITAQKPLQAVHGNLRGSYTNINSMKYTTPGLGGSHQNLYKSSKPPISNQQAVKPPLLSNLKTMGTKLKGSYTSLRPISANLPVVPPKDSMDDMNSTFSMRQTAYRPSMATTSSINTFTRNKAPSSTRTVPSQPSLDSTFVHPQVVRASGLPRPTGIPRPSSRIPGPRSTIPRPTSSRNKNY